MLVAANAMFISAKAESFTDKSGKAIQFQRVVFMADGDDDTMSLTAPADLDMAGFSKLDDVMVTLNVYKDFKGYLKAKVVNVEPRK